MINPLKVLITGTNKGIGFDLVKIFLKKHPQAIIYATSREKKSVAQNRWTQINQQNRVICKHLNLNSYDSIIQFVQQISKQNTVFDILINNAAIYRIQDDTDSLPELQWAKTLLQTNLIGPITLTKLLLPFLSQKGRIVNVSSLMGALNFHSPEIQQRFSNPNIQEEDIINQAKSYIQSVQTGEMQGKCSNPYSTSKMLLNAWSRFILQKKWLKKHQTAICVTPGFCRTPMTKDTYPEKDAHSSQSGALKIYEAALLKDANPDIFYHRSDPSDFFLCGQGIPFKDD